MARQLYHLNIRPRRSNHKPGNINPNQAGLGQWCQLLLFLPSLPTQDQRKEKPNMFPNQAPRISSYSACPQPPQEDLPSIRTHWSLPFSPTAPQLPSPCLPLSLCQTPVMVVDSPAITELSNKRLLFVLPGVVLVYFCSHLPKVHWLNEEIDYVPLSCALTHMWASNVALLLMTQNTTHTLVSTHTLLE